jgi:hypothetical protein
MDGPLNFEKDWRNMAGYWHFSDDSATQINPKKGGDRAHLRFGAPKTPKGGTPTV